MIIEYAVIIGILLIGYFLYTLSLEFKKEGNIFLYYLLFFLSTLMIPVITSILVTIVRDLGVSVDANYTNLLTIVDGLNTTFWWVFVIMWMLLLLLLFNNKLRESTARLKI